jgi:Tol biopolymer transport system component
VSDRDGNAEIYVMTADGSSPRNLTIHGSDDVSPTWSPDGSQIAFVSDRDGNWEIYVMDADGSNPRNLTHNSADDWGPVWRPAPPH